MSADADSAVTPPPRKSRPRPRGPRAGIVGPLFRWELVRLARRGQDHRARFILAASLLFILTVFTLIWFRHTDPRDLFFGTAQELSLQDSARFGDQFAMTFLLGQLAVLVLLTPAYAAGGIAEEKEKKTFVYLLVSDLTSREIVFGKFLGRLTFLLGIMLAGLPVLALTQVYGGVSLKFLLMGYFLTGTTVTMLAAVSAAAACATDTYRGALFRGYGLTALHVLVGCGLHPVLSPFVMIPMLSAIEPDSPEMFLVIGLGYGAAQLAVAVASVVMAIRWVRRLRARPYDRDPARRDRDRRDRRQDWEPKSLRKPAEERRTEPEIVEEVVAADELVAFDPAEANGEPVPTAAAVRAAPALRHVPVLPVVPPPPPRPRRRYREDPPPAPRLPAEVRNRPRVWADNPFLWKETYTTGAKQTADDDSIKGVMLAVGITVGITVGFFALIAVLAFLASGGSGKGPEVAENLLLLGGSGGFFTYLLVVGSGAAGAVVKERQRQTLESLLTIPVDRRKILWPKWVVTARKGWWWGVPATLTLPLGLLLSDEPVHGLIGLVFVAGAVPLAASLGLWLSIRCRTMTRAVLWLLPGIGLMTLTPVVVWSQTGPRNELWPGAVFAGLTLVVVGGGWVFWRLAVREFEQEGRT